MLNKSTYYILTILLLWGFTSYAQGGMQYWNTENGLSNDWVSSISQDKTGYVWIATQYGLNRFDGYDFKYHQYQPNNPSGISSNWIRSIAEDSTGTLWLTPYLVGVDAFNPKTGELTHYPLSKENDSASRAGVVSIHCDSKQNIWVGSSQGLFVKKATESSFKLIQKGNFSTIKENSKNKIFAITHEKIFQIDINDFGVEEIMSFEARKYRSIHVDHSDVLWIFGSNELIQLFQKNNEWIQDVLKIENSAHFHFFFDTPIYEDSKNQLWLGGHNGISIVNPARSNIETIPYESLFPIGKPIGKALSFFEDRHGNFWIGTSKGLLMKSPFTLRFELSDNIPHLENFKEVRSMAQVGNSFFISNPKGLSCIRIDQPEQAPISIRSDIFANHIIHTDDDFIYAGGWEFIKVDPFTLKDQVYTKNSTDKDIHGGRIWTHAEEANGKLWIGGGGVLNYFDPNTGKTLHFTDEELPSGSIMSSQTILLDKKGNLWLGSLYSGVYMIKQPSKSQPGTSFDLEHYTYDEASAESMTNPVVLALAEDNQGHIWVGTDSGLNRINPETKSVKRYLKKDGLVDEKIMGLVIDNSGDLWGSTIGHGIFRLNPENETFTFFDRRDGLVSNNFLLNAVLKNKEGKLFFGSDNTIQVIDPSLIDGVQKPNVPLLFTELKITKNEGDAGRSISLLDKQSLEIPYGNPSFSIQFSTLNFHQAAKTNYYYQLEGVHQNWQSNGSNREILFTGLAPGTYQLNIKAENPDLIFTYPEKNIQIVISPPWWRSKMAYFSYFILMAGGGYWLYQFSLKRQIEKNKAQKLQELDTMKTDFYTNITHEFRTPLTIILGMADQLKQHSKINIRHKGELVHRNGKQLLELINQLLDLSKLEAGKLPIEWVHGNLIPYISYICESFQSLASTEGIELHFLQEVDELWMDYDAEKIKQIVSNLISNAIKHTPQNGHIYIQIRRNNNRAEFVFRDTGIGIPESDLPYIFERFYQAKSKAGGTGIGLTFTKEMVGLLGGNIRVESQTNHFGEKKGTTFTILLPIKNVANVPSAVLPKNENQKIHLVETSSYIDEKGIQEEHIPLVLIIEDNRDVIHYLVDCLHHKYRLEIASNGQEGIEKALELIPDLIISDVMMPEKDGFEVCAALKTDNKTSHIPIVLLTAKADLSSKIEGLTHGADAYLAKPFDAIELHAQIQNLLELRQRLQQRYQDPSFWSDVKNVTSSNQEDAFVLKVRELLEENLSDSSFGIPQLCQKLKISRVHLHRKLKALTNQSTSQFIREIRLRKAHYLLLNSEMNVSEVAYEVGFEDPAYFSRTYSSFFGNAPSDTRK